MWKRYVIPCVLVFLIGGGIAAAVYRQTKVNFEAACVFEVGLPATSQTNVTDVITFESAQAGNEVRKAGRADVFSGPAAIAGMPAATLAEEINLVQVPISPDFTITVDDADATRAQRAANLMCDSYVKQVQRQRQQAKDLEVAQLQQQLNTLQQQIDAELAIAPADRPAGSDLVTNARQKAVASDQNLLASTLSLPPDSISVITTAPFAVRNDTRNLTRNLLVAGVASMLACFIIILIGEVIKEPRSRQ